MTDTLWNVAAADHIELEDIETASVDEAKRIRAVVDKMADAVLSQLEANSISNCGEDDWVRRTTGALGFAKMAQKRCARRLKALGCLENGEDAVISAARQQRHIDRLNQKLKRTGLDREYVAAAQAILSPERHAEILAVAAQQVQENADAVDLNEKTPPARS